ncbi:MAG: RloB family protein [Agathobacter sp.]|nr:RloB family protein [Agathobacter sp.]
MNSSRNFNKQRAKNRQRNKVILLMLENPSNKTEFTYFTSLQRDLKRVTLRPIKSKYSDPINMLNELKRKQEANEQDISKAYVVLDLDVNQNRINVISNLNKQDQKIFIMSNPCFEIWYLNHKDYTTHFFESSSNVKKFISQDKYIPGYHESMDVYDLLSPYINDAILNSKKQVEYGEDLYSWPSKDFNPRTDVYKLVEEIIELDSESS